MPLTREQVEAEGPDLVTTWRAEGAAAERERIQGVRATLIPGHEALVERLAFDGQTTPAQAALAVNEAERDLRKRHAAASAQDAPTPVALEPIAGVSAGSQAPRAAADPSDPDAFEAACKAEWDKDAKVRSEFAAFATYHAYRKAEAAGRVRILSK